MCSWQWVVGRADDTERTPWKENNKKVQNPPDGRMGARVGERKKKVGQIGKKSCSIDVKSLIGCVALQNGRLNSG